MSVLISKMASRILAVHSISASAALPLAQFRFLSNIPLPHLRRELITAAFIVVSFLIAAFYFVELNIIVLNGRKIPVLEAAIAKLEHEYKIKHAALAATRSPSLIKQEAVGQMRMIEVGSVRYIGGQSTLTAHQIYPKD